MSWPTFVRDLEEALDGAVEDRCSNCGETVLLSRAAQERLKQGYTVGCARCVAKAFEAQPDARPNIQLPTLAEMADAFGLTEKN